jgi:hypothetical protein
MAHQRDQNGRAHDERGIQESMPVLREKLDHAIDHAMDHAIDHAIDHAMDHPSRAFGAFPTHSLPVRFPGWSALAAYDALLFLLSVELKIAGWRG